MTSPPTTGEMTALARLFAMAGRLKETPRTGWIDRGIPRACVESVADHSFRAALMAWLLAGPELDRGRVLRLALIHDLAEAETGDLTPYAPADLPDETDGERRRAFLDGRHPPAAERVAAKRRAESEAFGRMIAGLPEESATELSGLWRELEARESPEARFVKQIDRLETYLQSREYAARDPELPVASFAAEVADGVTDPRLVALREAIAALFTDEGDRVFDQPLGDGVAGGSPAAPKSNLIN
jgi:putative hydrolase of HD superfamily